MELLSDTVHRPTPYICLKVTPLGYAGMHCVCRCRAGHLAREVAVVVLRRPAFCVHLPGTLSADVGQC